MLEPHDVLSEALWDRHRGDDGRAAAADEYLGALAESGWVVVSRTDLEWAVRLIENVHTVMWPNAKDVPYVEFDRLRAVLNTENQT